MKRRSKNSRQVRKQDSNKLYSVARSIGTALGSIAARTERLREKSLTIGAEAGSLARKTRKRLSSGSRRRTRPTRPKSQ